MNNHKQTMKKPIFQNRIVGYGEKPAKEFVFNPANWRVHPAVQRAAINEVLDKIGWVAGVLESVNSGYLIDGHLRVAETLARDPDELIPYTKLDLTENEEKQILLILDPIGAMAETDNDKFLALCDSLQNNLTAIESMRESLEMPDIDLDEFFQSVIETDKPNNELWNKMYHYYALNKDAFLERYHQRSNSETCFSMVKAKFSGTLRSKTRTAQINEALCKILCHNLCCLIQSMCEFGVKPDFWKEIV